MKEPEPDEFSVTHAKLHVFTNHGKTFTFSSVSGLESNESQVSFQYKAKSDGMWKTAYFNTANIAGYSVLEA